MAKKRLISKDQVKHVAQLAGLTLTSSQVEKFTLQLGDTLDYINRLKKVATEGVCPTSQVTGLENVYREDKTRPSLSQEEVLSNTGEKHKGYFLIKAIFEDVT